jgi:hypothetical protein
VLLLHCLVSNGLAIGVLTAVRFVVGDGVIGKALVPSAVLDPLLRSQGGGSDRDSPLGIRPIALTRLLG